MKSFGDNYPVNEIPWAITDYRLPPYVTETETELHVVTVRGLGGGGGVFYGVGEWPGNVSAAACGQLLPTVQFH